MAQQVEHFHGKEEAAGSNPAAGSTLKNYYFTESDKLSDFLFLKIKRG